MLDFTSAYEQVYGPGGTDSRIEKERASEQKAASQENVLEFGSRQASVQVQPLFSSAVDKKVKGEKVHIFPPLESQFVFGREPLSPPQERISERLREDAKTSDKHDASVARFTFERSRPVFRFGEYRPPFPRVRPVEGDKVETSHIIFDGPGSSPISMNESALDARPLVGDSALGEDDRLVGHDDATEKVNASVSCRDGAAVERGCPYVMMPSVCNDTVGDEEARVDGSGIDGQLLMVGPQDSLVAYGHQTLIVDSDGYDSGQSTYSSIVDSSNQSESMARMRVDSNIGSDQSLCHSDCSEQKDASHGIGLLESRVDSVVADELPSPGEQKLISPCVRTRLALVLDNGMEVTLTVDSNIASLFRQALEHQFPYRDCDSLCVDAVDHRVTFGILLATNQDLRIESCIDESQLIGACAFDKKYRISLSTLRKNHFSVCRDSFCRFRLHDSVSVASLDSDCGLALINACKADLLKLGKPTVKLKAKNLHLQLSDRLMVNLRLAHCSFMVKPMVKLKQRIDIIIYSIIGYVLTLIFGLKMHKENLRVALVYDKASAMNLHLALKAITARSLIINWVLTEISLNANECIAVVMKAIRCSCMAFGYRFCQRSPIHGMRIQLRKG